MFEFSFEKLLVLLFIALFILGPERLPEAAGWLGRAIGKAKAFAADTSDELRRDFGPEFDTLKQPLNDLREPIAQLRNIRDPRGLTLQKFSDSIRSDPEPEIHPGFPPPIASRRADESAAESLTNDSRLS